MATKLFLRKSIFIVALCFAIGLFFGGDSILGQGRIDVQEIAGDTPTNIAQSDADWPFTLVLESYPDGLTKASELAWGDYDQDGDLDLAVGFERGGLRIYMNTDGLFTQSPESLKGIDGDPLGDTLVTSLAWGDCDNDGDLDLAIGNSENNHNYIYVNIGNKQWKRRSFGDIQNDTKSITWGDYDNDGYLDLAVGNYQQPNYIYRQQNCNITEDSTSIALTEPQNSTKSVAWGDYDGDQDLDLLVGNFEDPNLIYENRNGVFEPETCWENADAATTSVAWADYNNDGKLDFAVGNDGVKNKDYVYLNLDNDNDLGCFGRRTIEFNETQTQDIRWGDYDSDGDLDIVIGNSGGQASTVCANTGTGFGLECLDAVQPIGDANSTSTIAWGDFDNDGDLDLAIGNLSQPAVQVYRNEIGVLHTQAVWSASEIQQTNSIAWGDFDQNGNLDLSVGNYAPDINGIYFNTVLATSQHTLTWHSITANADNTMAIVVGDADGDSYLDLVAANAGRANTLYTNDQTNGFFETYPFGLETNQTHAVAWGNINQDSNLDLAIGNNEKQQNYVHYNGNKWVSPENDNTKDIAWGDCDNDGDLDLAVANNYGEDHSSVGCNRVYQNIAGNLVLTWTAPACGQTNALAWVDYDGDGDLDLVFANDKSEDELYQNEGCQFTKETELILSRKESTSSIAWADYDGDGDQDWAVGNAEDGGRPSANYLYRNDSLKSSINFYKDDIWMWKSDETDNTTSVAWGDYDNDGDLDLAVGNDGDPNRIYLNHRAENVMAANVPAVKITYPGLAGEANFYASARPITDSQIAIPYTLYHPKSIPADHISATYSLNGGGHWQKAVVASDCVTSNLSSSPAPTGTSHTFVWDVQASGVPVESRYDNVVFRIMVVPSVEPIAGIAGPYLYGSFASDTFPFSISTEPVPLESVSIEGPSRGAFGYPYTFTAQIDPAIATPPITYTWEANGQTPVTKSNSSTISFTWPAPPTQTAQLPLTQTHMITITAKNAWGDTVSSTHTITVTNPWTWTFMVYLNGDNDLNDYARYIHKELESVAHNPYVNVVMLRDRPINSYEQGTDFCYSDNGNSEFTCEERPEHDMGSVDVLQGFITEARKLFPADYYALSIFDHGGPWSPSTTALQPHKNHWLYSQIGLSWDSTGGIPDIDENGNSINIATYLSTKDLGDALGEATIYAGKPKIDLLFIDACLTSSIEWIYEVKDYVDYVVSYENLGIVTSSSNNQDDRSPYRDYIASVNGGTSPREFAENIIDNYMIAFDNYITTEDVEDPIILSATDIHYIKDLSASIVSLSKCLTETLKNNNLNVNSAIEEVYLETQKLDYDADDKIEVHDGMADLYHFAYLLSTKEALGNTCIPAQAQAVYKAVRQTTFYVRRGGEFQGELDNAHGLSIYLPFGEEMYVGDKCPTDYSQLPLCKPNKNEGCFRLRDLYNGVSLNFIEDNPQWIKWINEYINYLCNKDNAVLSASGVQQINRQAEVFKGPMGPPMPRKCYLPIILRVE
jgi:hypothetical protein